MKLFTASALILPAIVLGSNYVDLETLSARLYPVAKNYFNGLDFDSQLAILGREMGAGVGRSFGAPWVKHLLEPIYGYGCWCYFQDDFGKGKGRPKNAVDRQCRELQRGYACVLLEANETGDNCIPWEVKYNATTGLGSDPNMESFEDLLTNKCAMYNDNECSRKACIIESYFLINLLEPLMTEAFNPSLKHELGWDPIVQCAKPDKEPDTADPEIEYEPVTSCCGHYPHRFPFTTVNGERACCNTKTYDTSKLQCCNNSFISMSCEM